MIDRLMHGEQVLTFVGRRFGRLFRKDEAEEFSICHCSAELESTKSPPSERLIRLVLWKIKMLTMEFLSFLQV